MLKFFKYKVQKTKSILVVLLLGILVFQGYISQLCLDHPFGHEHHEHDGPSTCELHEKFAGVDGQHLLPPMECEHISSQIDDFNQTQTEKIVPAIQLAAIIAVVFDLVSSDNQQEPFLLPPVPNCRSATLFSESPLRAPPLV